MKSKCDTLITELFEIRKKCNSPLFAEFQVFYRKRIPSHKEDVVDKISLVRLCTVVIKSGSVLLFIYWFKAWGWKDFFFLWPFSVSCYLSLGFSSKSQFIPVHSLG